MLFVSLPTQLRAPTAKLALVSIQITDIIRNYCENMVGI